MPAAGWLGQLMVRGPVQSNWRTCPLMVAIITVGVANWSGLPHELAPRARNKTITRVRTFDILNPTLDQRPLARGSEILHTLPARRTSASGGSSTVRESSPWRTLIEQSNWVTGRRALFLRDC